AILPEYLSEAVDILADILRASLRTDDFDMEKHVIIEEIGMYEDQPMWSAYDAAKRAHFAGHPLANSILGTVKSIKKLKRDQMHAYFKRRYVAPNITAVAAGRFPWKQLVALMNQHCGGWEKGLIGRKGVRETKGAGTFHVVKKDKVTQEHVFMISPGPPVESPLRYAADILATAVGDDSGSRLYWALVDPGLADTADCSFHDYEGTGSFYTSLSCEPGRTEENLQVVLDVLRDVQRQGITGEELQQAK